MAIKKKDELMATLKTRMGEDSSDESLSLIEDISDTFDDLTNKAKVDWETKYQELDKSWRERYRNRFFNGNNNDDDEDNDDDMSNRGNKPLTFNELFKEG